MSGSNKLVVPVNPNYRQFQTKAHCPPCLCADECSSLAIYNIRFPANICEHQTPYFDRRPSSLPGRGGGSITVPTEKPAPVVAPKPDDQPAKTPRSSAKASSGVKKQRKSSTRSSNSNAVKMAKRDAVNRFTSLLVQFMRILTVQAVTKPRFITRGLGPHDVTIEFN